MQKGHFLSAYSEKKLYVASYLTISLMAILKRYKNFFKIVQLSGW